MTWPVHIGDLGERLDLRNDRIGNSDALRQQRTIADILRRLGNQPGIVLADEVGMGKTFVALGVAMLAALADRGRRPVVIMVPSSLHEKWPRDFAVFAERAIKRPGEKALRAVPVASALDFFRLIDSGAASRPQIIFLKHGAFHVQNIDQWVRLALIKRAISGMHLGEKRNALPRFAAALLRTKSSYNDPDLFAKLLRISNREWRHVINDHYRDRLDLQLSDAPIPDAIQRVLESSEIDIATLRDCLRDLRARESASIEDRLERARRAINDALRTMWPSTLAKARFRSPLLILDEAHHLKNPATRLASLFVTDDARVDAGTITGALDGSFERMMFLTATPFQLGHHELLNVIGRFRGVAWKTLSQSTKEQFEAELASLGATLDRAQHRAAELDKRWSSLRQEDLVDTRGQALSVEDWWDRIVANSEDQPERVQMVMRSFQQARDAMKEADPRQRFARDRCWTVLGDVVEAAAQMGPAEGKRDRLASGTVGNGLVGGIAVALHDAAIAVEQLERVDGAATWGVGVSHRRRVGPAPGPIVARDRPEEALLGAAAAGLQHRRHGLVDCDLARGQNDLAQPPPQRMKLRGGIAHPERQHGALDVDALRQQHLGLPTEQQMPGIFGDQHVGDHRLGGQPALDQPLWCRRLKHAIRAGPAGIFGTMRDDHAELRRNDVEPLRRFLANHVHCRMAARAVGGFRCNRHVDVRQIGRKRAPMGAALLGALASARGILLVLGRLVGDHGLLDILDRQLQLFRIELLRAAPELRALQLPAGGGAAGLSATARGRVP